MASAVSLRRKARRLRSRYLAHRKKGHKAYKLRRAYQRARRAVSAANRNDFQPYMLNGRRGNVSADCKRFIVRAVKAGLVVTSTTGGAHAKNSYHYSGRAVDVAGPWKKMVAFQRQEAKRPRTYVELFGPENRWCVKNGRLISIQEGTALEQNHDNHIHAAI